MSTTQLVVPGVPNSEVAELKRIAKERTRATGATQSVAALVRESIKLLLKAEQIEAAGPA
jgi:pseudouridine-5'-phosphate glycosidase